MADTASLHTNTDESQSKRALQKQMERTRESMAETVEEIKHTVNEQVAVAKKAVSGVLDYREQFQQEPLVWSLGALSAGFALGYTMGFAHKESKHGRGNSELKHFTESLIDELSLVGNSVVMPPLNAHIKQMFGFDFREVLDSIQKNGKSPRKAAVKKRKRSTKTRRKSTRKPSH
jgi:hypothetical protein